MSARMLMALVGSVTLLGTSSLRADDPKADIAGYWDWQDGFLNFQTAPVAGKKHLAVSGSYHVGRDQKGTILAGTYDPASGVLEYSFEEPWRNPSKGTARYVLSADGKRFKGSFKIGDDKGDLTFSRVPGDTFAARVESIVANAGIHAETPGCAVLVMEGDKVRFERGYGLAHLRAKDKKPITRFTTFELASCSKQFTGTAILLLHERGLLQLDDDVRKYLPELPEYDKKHPIRILDLARHSSGLPEYLEFQDVKGKNPNFLVNEDFVGEYARQRKKFPLYFAPGEKSRYTNTNYMLMALIVERISKKSFAAFMKSEIFEPLGMKTAAVYENPKAAIKEPALGYRKEKGKFEEVWGPPPFRNETLLAVGDGSIWVSLTDMIQWDEGWRHGKLLKPATIEQWLVPSKTRDGKNNDYAFGWIVDVDKGKLLHMSHAGAWGGFRTSVDRDLVTKRSIIVLSNYDSVDPGAIGGPLEHLCWAMPQKGK